MGAIKDIADLVTQLSKSIKDREFGAALLNIQGMLAGLQSEQAELHEKNITLMRENEELKKKMALLQIIKDQQPKQDELTKESIEILKCVFELAVECSAQQIASIFKMKQGVADFHIRQLEKKHFVLWNFGRFGSTMEPTFSITPEGQEYIVKNGLA